MMELCKLSEISGMIEKHRVPSLNDRHFINVSVDKSWNDFHGNIFKNNSDC